MFETNQWTKLSRVLSINLVILVYLAAYRSEPERRTIADLTMQTGLGRTTLTKRITNLHEDGLLISQPHRRAPGSRGPGAVTTWQLTEKGGSELDAEIGPLINLLDKYPDLASPVQQDESITTGGRFATG